MDVVYVVGDLTEELRYSLRSLRFVDHDRVWIVGSLPDWATNVEHIDVRDEWEKARNITEKLYAAATHPEVSDRFIYFNDDFFALRPTTVPNRHRGKIDVEKPRFEMRGRLSLRESREWTFYHLHTWNVDPVISYDFVHTPMVMDKSGVAASIDKARSVGLLAPQVRSLYGNLCGIGGVEGPNVKRNHGMEIPRDWDWVSTNVNSWKSKAGAEIRALFPDPSPYEKEA